MLMKVHSLDAKRFTINRLEDDVMSFQRKPETPENVLLFPEEADRLHERGYDVFVLAPSFDDPAQFSLKVFPCPKLIERHEGYWVRKFKDHTIYISLVEFPLDMPEVEPGAHGHFLGYFGSDFPSALAAATLHIKSLGQPGFLFDFSDRYIKVLHKGTIN